MRTTTGSGIVRHHARGRVAQRQREQERDAAAGDVLRPDAPAVRAHDAAADGQPETGAAAADGPGAAELLDHLVLGARRQAGTVVGDLDRDVAVAGGGDELDGAAAGR